ncbi:MAG TPA: histidine kinase N-terminal domain-containing protein [Anaerolineae bacterium]|nr:histidine kinase N-terminal domain-containing protein [Anaerolineae bacterium]
MSTILQRCRHLNKEDLATLTKIQGDLGILADLSRADVLLYCACEGDRAVVVCQAQPHSILPVYSESQVEHQISFSDGPAVLRALGEGRRGQMEVRRAIGKRPGQARTATIVQETFPIYSEDNRVIAAASIETNLIEQERHRRRSKAFRLAMRQFREMVLAGRLRGAERLTPLGEQDGLMIVDAQHHIQYLSETATSLYRNLGYAGGLLKRRVEDLELDDHSLLLDALEHGRCQEGEVKVGDLVWIKKAIPLLTRRSRLVGRGEAGWRVQGAILVVHDETEARRREDELQVKVTMIREIHHRVKNNMQTIASLLRLQSRRAESDEVRRALQEGINRILSVAVIHEFLAHQDARVINIRDVSQRIINQVREGVLDHECRIRLDLKGPNIYLPTQPATVCALVINELLQNALEHGYDRQDVGTVTVDLHDNGDRVTIAVEDDGLGLPGDFRLEESNSLGLHIVKTLAEGDLKGKFELRGRDKGVSAIVTFPKHT